MVGGHDRLILDESKRIERQWKAKIIMWILRTQKSCITLAERMPGPFCDWVAWGLGAVFAGRVVLRRDDRVIHVRWH